MSPFLDGRFVYQGAYGSILQRCTAAASRKLGRLRGRPVSQSSSPPSALHRTHPAEKPALWVLEMLPPHTSQSLSHPGRGLCPPYSLSFGLSWLGPASGRTHLRRPKEETCRRLLPAGSEEGVNSMKLNCRALGKAVQGGQAAWSMPKAPTATLP